jgi:hypothetical protein
VFEPDGERLSHCCSVVIQARRNLHEEVLVKKHVFAEPAGTVVVVANYAMRTRLSHYRHGGNALAWLDRSLAARSIVDHLADILMAGHEEFVEIQAGIGTPIFPREFDHLLARTEKVDVGCAEPA